MTNLQTVNVQDFLSLNPNIHRRINDHLFSNGKALEEDKYILLDSSEIFSYDLSTLYPLFDNLEPDIKEVHKTRMRARAKFDFNVDNEGNLYMREASSVTLYDKTGFRGPREHKRFFLLNFPGFADLAANFISLALSQTKYVSGYIAFEVFRTFDDVVYGFHQDGEHYVGLYCIKRECAEAKTQLSLDKEGKNVIFDGELKAGQALFFKDSSVFHYTGSLAALDDGTTPFRDAIIITLSGVLQRLP